MVLTADRAVLVAHSGTSQSRVLDRYQQHLQHCAPYSSVVHSAGRAARVVHIVWHSQGCWTDTTLPVALVTFTVTRPLTSRVIGAPETTSQLVSSIFPCSPLPSGTLRTPGLSIPLCCLPTSFYACLVFYCVLQDGFGQTWWTGDVSIPLQFASLYTVYPTHQSVVLSAGWVTRVIWTTDTTQGAGPLPQHADRTPGLSTALHKPQVPRS